MLRAIAIDDEETVLKDTLGIIKEVKSISGCVGFTNPQTAIDYVKQNIVDIAFLDVKMPEMSGLEMAKKLKEISKHIAIVFISGFPDYAVDSYKLKASGYLLKPVEKEAIEEEINYVISGVQPISAKRVKIVTFGNFDAYVDGEKLRFQRSKTKELFAYLVDRKGGSVTCGEAIGIVWEDAPNNNTLKSMFRNLVSDMMKTLKEHNCENIIEKKRNEYFINKELVSCDYYDFLAGDIFAINSFNGEYMSNYSWADFTLAYIEDKNKR